MFVKNYINYSMMFLFCITTSMVSYTKQKHHLVKVKKQDDLQKLSPKESVSFKEYKKELDKGSRIGAHKIFVAIIKNGSPELRRLYCKEQIKLLNSY